MLWPTIYGTHNDHLTHLISLFLYFVNKNNIFTDNIKILFNFSFQYIFAKLLLFQRKTILIK